MELLPGDPPWLLDVAHNPHAASALAAVLADRYVPGRTLAVLGMLSDKDAAGVVQALAGQVDHWLLAAVDGARGMSAEQLRARLPADLSCELCGGVGDALQSARDTAAPGDQVVVLGSFLVVGQAHAWLAAHGVGDSL
jgi:dihydrofolate synthase/folylpolyglutamate synthase